MPSSEIKTNAATVRLSEDGIVELICDKGVKMTLSDIVEQIAAYDQLIGDTAHPFLIDFSQTASFTFAARKQVTTYVWPRITKAALIVNSGHARILTNIFLSIERPKFPFKVFQNKVDALAWLDSSGPSSGKEIDEDPIKQFNQKYASTWRARWDERGIVIFEAIDRLTIDLQQMQDILLTEQKIHEAHGFKVKSLCLGALIVGTSPDAMKMSIDKSTSTYIESFAMVTHKTISRTLTNFFLKIYAPPYQSRLFASEESAVQWLLKDEPLAQEVDGAKTRIGNGLIVSELGQGVLSIVYTISLEVSEKEAIELSIVYNQATDGRKLPLLVDVRSFSWGRIKRFYDHLFYSGIPGAAQFVAIVVRGSVARWFFDFVSAYGQIRPQIRFFSSSSNALSWLKSQNKCFVSATLSELQSRSVLTSKLIDLASRNFHTDMEFARIHPGYQEMATAITILGDELSNTVDKLERRLWTHEAKTAMIIDTAPQGIITTDLNLNILIFNRASEGLCDLKRESVVGKSIKGLIAPEYLNLFEEFLYNLPSKGSRDEVKLYIERSDRRMIPVNMHLNAASIQGEPIYIFILENLTKFIESKNILIAEKIKAEKAVASRNDFLARVSHELRTPLHGIISFAEIILETIDRKHVIDPEDAKDYTANIYESSMRLLGLVDDLLDLSQIDSGKMQYHFDFGNLKTITERAMESLNATLLAKNLTWKFTVESTNTVSYLDEKRIYQVIINVLANAIKFSSKDQVIEVCVGCCPKADAITMSVINTGPQMPKKDLDLVFEKFSRSSATSSKAGGTGLGLAICRGIVEAHNGKIWIENIGDHQTKTMFYLSNSIAQKSA